MNGKISFIICVFLNYKKLKLEFKNIFKFYKTSALYLLSVLRGRHVLKYILLRKLDRIDVQNIIESQPNLVWNNFIHPIGIYRNFPIQYNKIKLIEI